MASIPNGFEWSESKPGRWERDVDEAEQFYTSLAKAYEGTGRTFFAMTGFISVCVPADGLSSSHPTENRAEEALRKAWLRLRYDHPTIASRVEHDVHGKKCRKIYETFTEASPQEDWLKETFQVLSTGASGLDWCNSDPPVPELPTLFLIKQPSSADGAFRADVVLRAHHDIIDGMGTLMLFNNLFAHAAEIYKLGESYTSPSFGGEWANLSPPLRVAAGIPKDLRPDQQDRLRDIIQSKESIKKDVEIASLPFRRDRMQPGKHQRVAVRLSVEQTRELLDKCREAGLSITHAYHTAIAVTVRGMQERHADERKVRYINYSLINERGRCKNPYRTWAHPVTAYHSVSGNSLAIDLNITSSLDTTDVASTTANDKAEFMGIAQVVKDFYLGIRDDKEHIFLVPSYWKMSTIPYPDDGATPPVPARNETPSASISSMGVIDKVISPTHGPFQLDNPWVTGEELGTGLGLFLGTWKGRLSLSVAYNDAWHDKDEAMAFLERCNQTTLRALGAQG
ncbi:hypothetical protein ABOM_002796 [Aspergillus bombycis]|uniref:Uncharacterized protein n=1 Tax=Aspergillus bombycis TaxID=109264 RepID=A0A1F8A8B2_9EURO|nr:hypothetical protein ABOM_002796 [Aspergillus bombycis]OGM47946.1 hypothetical protein ABOM_002796 [Aspergillus bombycis]